MWRLRNCSSVSSLPPRLPRAPAGSCRRRGITAGRMRREAETSVFETPRIVRPQRIILVRHGESAGNVNPAEYVNTPDWRIPLTTKGWQDSHRAGARMKEFIRDSPLYIYTSPYLRTKQTLAGMVSNFDTNEIIGVREEPRLTEQQFGNFQNVLHVRQSRELRRRFGRFYFRFPDGESGLDVYNRVTSFIATLFRDFANPDIAREDLNVVVVTHGLTLRLFLMRFFHYSVQDFEQSHNPLNGAFVVMQLVSDTTGGNIRQWYEIEYGREALNLPPLERVGSLWKILEETRPAWDQEEEAELASLRSEAEAHGCQETTDDSAALEGVDGLDKVDREKRGDLLDPDRHKPHDG